MSPADVFVDYDGHFITPYLAVGACAGRVKNSDFTPAIHVAEIVAAGVRSIHNVAGLTNRLDGLYWSPA